MTIFYTFEYNCRDYEYEYDADTSEAMHIVYAALKADGYDIDDEITEELIDEYIEYCMDDIKEYFYDAAYDEWKDNKSYNDDPMGYYGFSYKDFI